MIPKHKVPRPETSTPSSQAASASLLITTPPTPPPSAPASSASIPALASSRPAGSSRGRGALLLLCVGLLFAAYAARATQNPPGFYLDESSVAYNASRLAATGQDEHGVSWPLYFEAFGEYKNPVYLYLLAALFKLFGPGILLARLFSAACCFVAALSLGYLAWRISRRWMTGACIALTAMLTPWLFEPGRLVFEVALYPLALVLLLCALWRAHERVRWTVADGALIGLALGLLTYTYSIGRIHAPLLALGLLFFATRPRRRGLIAAWLVYAAWLAPLALFNARHPGALSSRFHLISYIKPGTPWPDIISNFALHYLGGLNLVPLLLTGENNIRHHVPGMGVLLFATFILALVGLDRIAHLARADAWWRFIIYGLLVSFIPAALTSDEFHTLRLIAVPVFVVLLNVPALAWLFERADESAALRFALIALLALTFLQGALFQYQFHTRGTLRGNAFEEVYPEVFQTTLDAAHGQRPIYLLDRGVLPGYIHAYWYGALAGIDRAQFIRLRGNTPPAPAGAVVVGTVETCANCQVLTRRQDYLVYRAQ